MPFPNHFLWGAATSAYQVEGALAADGRADSVWDMVCRRPGFIHRGETGDPACDHYNRMDADVALMAELGLKAYRFSVAWPRILPGGTSDQGVNDRGLAFYDRLVDALLRRGIEPLVTLFHWDYPTALFNRGGWLNRDSPQWFADYTRIVVDRLSDRVSTWLTLNEPQCFIGFGHEIGAHAPGLRLSLDQVLLAGHHALLAHGRAVQVIRERAKRPARVSWAPVGLADFPDDPASAADIEAARESTFGSSAAESEMGRSRVFVASWWVDPVVLGRYPEPLLREFGPAAPRPAPGDMELIAEPIDLLGLNYYFGRRVRAHAAAAPGEAPFEYVPPPVGAPSTTMGWPITPEGIYWMCRFYHERYGKPLLITENGRAVSDHPSADGRVRDPLRIAYLDAYLRQVERAIDEGVPVEGYCAWSLMDNFEWAHGYAQRFGLIHVDYATQRRTLKDSALWYRDVISRGGP